MVRMKFCQVPYNVLSGLFIRGGNYSIGLMNFSLSVSWFHHEGVRALFLPLARRVCPMYPHHLKSDNKNQQNK